MTARVVDFFDTIGRLCTDHDCAAVWQLALTHPSANKPNAQVALSHLGKIGMELVLAWYHVRTRQNRDGGTVSSQLASLSTAASWHEEFVCNETQAFYTVGKGLNMETLSLPVRKQFITAVLGACFFADTYKACELVQKWFTPYYECAANSTTNPKSELQQYAQSRYRVAPTYAVVGEEGPDHDKQFRVAVKIDGTRRSAQGWGGTKKLAEKDAAAELLRVLGVPNAVASNRPATPLLNAVLTGSALAKWCDEVRRDGGTYARRILGSAYRFSHFFREHAGVRLPAELANIALMHNSLNEGGPKDHWPLLLETWGMCDISRCGFSVVGSAGSFEITIPLATSVRVTRSGVCLQPDDDRTVNGSAPVASPDIEGARTALHEIKNRMISTPSQWYIELGECATNLMKVAQVLRAPEIQRVDLSQIRQCIDDTVASANALYGTNGTSEVIEDYGTGYADVEMVKTILKNLSDNAARSAAELVTGTWTIEGYVDSESLEVSVNNSCRNLGAAKECIEGIATKMRGTGLGVSTIKRLVGKLMGQVSYEFEDGMVVTRLVLPMSLAAHSW